MSVRQIHANAPEVTVIMYVIIPLVGIYVHVEMDID